MSAVSVIAGSLRPVDNAGDTARNVPTNLQEIPTRPVSSDRNLPIRVPAEFQKTNPDETKKVAQKDPSASGGRAGGEAHDDPMHTQFVQQRSFFSRQSGDPKPWARFL